MEVQAMNEIRSEIRQSELRAYLQARRVADDLKEYIRQRLTDGCLVEGGIHNAVLQIAEQRRVDWRAVVTRLQGASYVRRVTAATAPHVVERLLIR